MSQNFDYEPRETEQERIERENRLRAAEIARRFSEIDRERIRPLAAIVAGVGTDEDKERLKALEEEAAALRVELAGMED
ncbi:MAG: hypothetical protein J6B57_00720 [Oscillospiraceae bacterium]|nr:hypothetical protein [Oscillospiraceae bacterium]